MVHISHSTKKLLPKDKYIIRNRGVVKLKVIKSPSYHDFHIKTIKYTLGKKKYCFSLFASCNVSFSILLLFLGKRRRGNVLDIRK